MAKESKIYIKATRKAIKEIFGKKIKKPKWYKSSQRIGGWNPYDSVD